MAGFSNTLLATDEIRMELGLHSRVWSWCFGLGALFLDRIREDQFKSVAQLYGARHFKGIELFADQLRRVDRMLTA